MVAGGQRERILQAAAKLLKQQPLSELTIASVARTAGLSRQTVYAHFDGRDDLLASVFIDTADKTMRPIRSRLLLGPKTAATLEAIFWADVTASREFFVEHPSASAEVRASIAEFIVSQPRMQDYLQEMWLPTLQLFTEAGVMRPDLDAAETARWLSYQQAWLVAYPQALGGDSQAHGYVRRFVIDVIAG